MSNQFYLILSFFFLISCTSHKQINHPTKKSLFDFIDINHPKLKLVFDEVEKFEVQILYTQINRDSKNKPSFQTYSYRLNDDQYFYPASTVKMPMAFAALEAMEDIPKHYGVDFFTKLQIDSVAPEHIPVDQDHSSKSGNASLGHYIKKVFLVSDNDAYNRLYEFVGQYQLNKILHSKGLEHTKIIHRLSLPGYNEEMNMHTNPFQFLGSNGVYKKPAELSSFIYEHPLENSIKGKAYINSKGILTNEPFDFSKKNYISLHDNTAYLKRILFPNSFSKNERFDISDSNLEYLYAFMSMLPKESAFPTYPNESYPDNYVKFFIYGDQTQSIPDHIRIFNKVGFAYGYL
ncbi:MAG: serine hydrolase, partial [Bacteroidota bacterium]